MKNDYVVVTVADRYMVKERKTDQYLASYDHLALAHNLCALLNNGSGFEGETPTFFAKKILQITVRNSVN